MSGIPRTGLFSRNHLTTLTQRNRVLQNQKQGNENLNNDSYNFESTQERGEEKITIDSPNSSYASLPRDQEGFDDLDAFFNRASTPQKTPKSHKIRVSNPNSNLATPSSHRKTANVLIAKPLKMISSKIAEHYKKEPRLAVSLSEVVREQELESENENDEEELLCENEESEEGRNDGINNYDLNQDYNQDQNQDRHYIHNQEEDRIQKAKRELEEMSIESSFEAHHENALPASPYVKSSLNQSTTIINENNHMIDDDILMDRLVEEMLVNDIEHESNVEAVIQTTAPPPPQIPKKQRKTANKSGTGLTRRPLTYYSGAEMTEEGLRRSCRMKMEPLRYWANEKVCYGRAEDPSITLPVIVNVIKKPELDDPTFMMGLTRKRKRSDGGGGVNANKLRSQAFGPECDVEAEVNCYDRPGEEELRLLALSHHHVQGDEVKDSSFRIHTIFTEGSYMSSGQLIFPPASQKPTKNSSRHALVFYVICGSFRVEINRDSFLIGPGGQFHVPRANPYTITHVSSDNNLEGRLFFCHCKDNSE